MYFLARPCVRSTTRAPQSPLLEVNTDRLWMLIGARSDFWAGTRILRGVADESIGPPPKSPSGEPTSPPPLEDDDVGR